MFIGVHVFPGLRGCLIVHGWWCLENCALLKGSSLSGVCARGFLQTLVNRATPRVSDKQRLGCKLREGKR